MRQWEERLEILKHSCPGQGACGGMYTANTMATAIEALGTFFEFPIKDFDDCASFLLLTLFRLLHVVIAHLQISNRYVSSIFFIITR